LQLQVGRGSGQEMGRGGRGQGTGRGEAGERQGTSAGDDGIKDGARNPAMDGQADGGGDGKEGQDGPDDGCQ